MDDRWRLGPDQEAWAVALLLRRRWVTEAQVEAARAGLGPGEPLVAALARGLPPERVDALARDLAAVQGLSQAPGTAVAEPPPAPGTLSAPPRTPTVVLPREQPKE